MINTDKLLPVGTAVAAKKFGSAQGRLKQRYFMNCPIITWIFQCHLRISELRFWNHQGLQNTQRPPKQNFMIAWFCLIWRFAPDRPNSHSSPPLDGPFVSDAFAQSGKRKLSRGFFPLSHSALPPIVQTSVRPSNSLSHHENVSMSAMSLPSAPPPPLTGWFRFKPR